MAFKLPNVIEVGLLKPLIPDLRQIVEQLIPLTRSFMIPDKTPVRKNFPVVFKMGEWTIQADSTSFSGSMAAGINFTYLVNGSSRRIASYHIHSNGQPYGITPKTKRRITTVARAKWILRTLVMIDANRQQHITSSCQTLPFRSELLVMGKRFTDQALAHSGTTIKDYP